MSRKRAFENLKSKYCIEDISKIENYERKCIYNKKNV